MPCPQYKLVRLSAAALEPGDCLAFRRDGLIAIAGRSPYSHIGMVDIQGGVPMVIEMRGTGGRIVTLFSQLQTRDKAIDLLKVDVDRFPEFNRTAATNYMRMLAGQQYGWLSLARAALVHLPGWRLWFRASIYDNGAGTKIRRRPFCSDAYSAACRVAGIDPVLALGDRSTEPGDLGRSLLFPFEKRCTLTKG